MDQRPIYLDAHCTTSLDQRVLAAMLPYFTVHFGNPSSNTHVYGWVASAAVKNAREAIAESLSVMIQRLSAAGDGQGYINKF
ncbi:MAG: hypothetical protein RLZZ04_4025 [Cyanobacteriota bacterium]|jgi:cysteine desulfurase